MSQTCHYCGGVITGGGCSFQGVHISCMDKHAAEQAAARRERVREIVERAVEENYCHRAHEKPAAHRKHMVDEIAAALADIDNEEK